MKAGVLGGEQTDGIMTWGEREIKQEISKQEKQEKKNNNNNKLDDGRLLL